MPKMKTKSSAKKRFRTTATGKVRMNFSRKRHGMSKRPQKMIRSARRGKIMSEPDQRIVLRNFMPYAR